MQVHSINTVNTFYSTRQATSVKSKKSNSNPSFGAVINMGGKFFLDASSTTIRAYAELLRTLPEKAIRNVTKEYGFLHVKRGISNRAYERLSSEIKIVQKEVDSLKQSNDPKAKERLRDLYEKAESGAKDYYKEENAPIGDYTHESIEDLAAEITGHFI